MTSKNKIDKELDDVFIKFRHSMTVSMFKEAKETGLSLSHFEVLRFLLSKKNANMKDISEWLNIKPSSVSVLVDILIQKGYLSKEKSSKDKRNYYIKLEDKAHKLFNSIFKKKKIFFEKMVSKLSDEDKQSLIKILNKCIIK